MYIIISIFYISLLAMLFMIMLKGREVKTGRPTIISRMFARSDRFFHDIFGSVHRTISYINKHTFISLAQWIAYHILRHIRSGYLKVINRAHEYPHTKKVIDMVRGRGEVRKHGSSFYLKRISNE